MLCYYNAANISDQISERAQYKAALSLKTGLIQVFTINESFDISQQGTRTLVSGEVLLIAT